VKIGILVVAYNAVSTLAPVLDRIPPEFADDIAEVLVQDDASGDATYLVALGYQQQSSAWPLTVVRHPENKGYGGNQKAGYRYAIDHGWDIAVLLHGDGQYAPELLPEIVAPIVRGEADAVMGSRMMERGQARAGGMPLYKYAGNRVLTKFQNAVAGLDLTEWHSGYRAYRVSSLESIPFESNADGFNFDTQIILQLHDAGMQITEIPIPTYYGDEICYVNGLSYARDITRDTLRYRLGKAGFGTGVLGHVDEVYSLKPSPETSHGRIMAWMRDRKPERVLDVGCSGGLLAEQLRSFGHEVTGVDVVEFDGVRERTDSFVRADIDAGVPAEVGDGFDAVIAADVLEHVRDPEALLKELVGRLAPGGRILASVPNFGHWYPRGRVAVGRFGYDQRGILDKTHLRFFTRRSFHELVNGCGLRFSREEHTGLPLDSLATKPGRMSTAVRAADQVAANLRPQLFAYQFVAELIPVGDPY
jgi:glycosyltransferase involved in cell wall biosynthesis